MQVEETKPMIINKKNGDTSSRRKQTNDDEITPRESQYRLPSMIRLLWDIITYFLASIACYIILITIMENNNNDNDKSTFLLQMKHQIESINSKLFNESPLILKPITTIHKLINDHHHNEKLKTKSTNAVIKNNQNKQKREKMSKVQLGKMLLKNGDPVGAETLCKVEIESGTLTHNEHVNALICLGEARLALHNAAWNLGYYFVESSSSSSMSSTTSSDHDLLYNKLHLAQHDFEAAVTMEPTFLGARLGLGLTNFIIATREQPESSSQLLFNAILHFEAIHVLTSNEDGGDGEESGEWLPSNDTIDNMKLSAMYNNGLAHLALGDIKSAIKIFKDMSNIITNDNKSFLKVRSLVITNLAAALLLDGVSTQAEDVMMNLEDLRYCSSDSIQRDSIDQLTESQKRHLHKQCLILLNNLAIAKENQMTFQERTSLLKLSLKYEEKLGLEGASFTITNAKESMNHNRNETKGTGAKESFRDITALENTDSKNFSFHEWIEISKEKLKVGDVEDAINAARNGLYLAKGLEEVKVCMITIDEALEQLVLQTSISNSCMEKDNNIEIIQLEKEISRLKIELKKRENNVKIEPIENIKDDNSENYEDGKAINAQDSDENNSIQNKDEFAQKHTSNAKETIIRESVIKDINVTIPAPMDPIVIEESSETNDKAQAESVEAATATDEKVDDGFVSVNHSVTESIAKSSGPSNQDIEEEPSQLPELFVPTKNDPDLIDASSEGYMKMADAYIQQNNYKLASKQFLKVLKRSPKYIPAILGYATSMERYVKPKQMDEVAIAYANATISALEQGKENLAVATFQRSLQVSKSFDGDRLQVLQYLATTAFNNDLGAEIYYELGLELNEVNLSSPSDAIKAFKISNKFGSSPESEFYSKSLFQIAKLLFNEGKLEQATQLIKKALSHNLNELEAEAYVLSGQIKEKLLDINGAVEDYNNAISSPQSNSTAQAYYYLSLALKSLNGDTKTIENYMEVALNLGIDVTPQAIEILGQQHNAVIRSAHRTELKTYQESLTDETANLGGVRLSSSESIMTASKNSREDKNVDTLSMLKQGATSEVNK